MILHPTYLAIKQGVSTAVVPAVSQCQRCCRWDLLYFEIICCQASIVDAKNQAGIVSSGIKHLEQVYKTKRLFRVLTKDKPTKS